MLHTAGPGGARVAQYAEPARCSPAPTPPRWTPRLDFALRCAIQEIEPPTDWIRVAAAVSAHISASHCRHRWLSKLSRCNTKGKWIAEEDAMLRRIVDRSGTRDWATIAEQMPGRSVKQCREHWQNYLAAGLTHSEWTAAEDRTLLDLAGRYGRSWQRIAAHMPGRPSNCVKNRWYLLMRREAASAKENEGPCALGPPRASPLHANTAPLSACGPSCGGAALAHLPAQRSGPAPASRAAAAVAEALARQLDAADLPPSRAPADSCVASGAAKRSRRARARPSCPAPGSGPATQAAAAASPRSPPPRRPRLLLAAEQGTAPHATPHGGGGAVQPMEPGSAARGAGPLFGEGLSAFSPLFASPPPTALRAPATPEALRGPWPRPSPWSLRESMWPAQSPPAPRTPGGAAAAKSDEGPPPVAGDSGDPLGGLCTSPTLASILAAGRDGGSSPDDSAAPGAPGPALGGLEDEDWLLSANSLQL